MIFRLVCIKNSFPSVTDKALNKQHARRATWQNMQSVAKQTVHARKIFQSFAY